MTRCRFAQKRIVALHDQELAPAVATRVREHLRVCPCCLAQSKQLQSLDIQSNLSVPAHLTIAYHHRLDRALDEARQSSNTRINESRRTHSIRTFRLCASIAFAVAVTTTILTLAPFESTHDSKQSANWPSAQNSSSIAPPSSPFGSTSSSPGVIVAPERWF